MSKIYKGYEAGKQIFGALKKVFTGGGKQKTYGTGAINKVEPNVPVTKGQKIRRDLALATQKRKTSEVKLDNTIFRIEQQKKRLEDMQKAKSQTQTRPGKQNLVKGGRVGLKRGTGLMNRKSNIQKIKETFGPKQKPQSRMTGKKKKFPDMSGDGKITKKDILIARGVIPKPKKKVI